MTAAALANMSPAARANVAFGLALQSAHDDASKADAAVVTAQRALAAAMSEATKAKTLVSLLSATQDHHQRLEKQVANAGPTIIN
jgi:hypothetical protein